MNIKDLEVRMYYLAGQLEEAKKVYREAIEEIQKQEEAMKKAKTETVSTPSDSTVELVEAN